MSVLTWEITYTDSFTLITYTLSTEVIRPSDLAQIDIPAELASRRHLGLIISGRGPVWLFSHLVHRAHPFAWVAVFDPRLDAGVVVMNHLPDGPPVGSLVSVSAGG